MKTKEKENGQPAKKSKIALAWERKDRPIFDIVDMRAVLK
jgi:hypothetical protein